MRGLFDSCGPQSTSSLVLRTTDAKVRGIFENVCRRWRVRVETFAPVV
jgi:hypothetical protein